MIVRRCAALGLVLWAGGIGCSEQGGGAGAAVGPCAAVADRISAPDLKLKALDGHEYSLSALKGKTVVLDFWATWCPPCEFQVPILNAVYDAWRDRGVMVLGVSVDADGAADGVHAATQVRYLSPR
jgi:cytochrome oxidase Cu insertion factor (SCO1/SenC/PrrC family)